MTRDFHDDDDDNDKEGQVISAFVTLYRWFFVLSKNHVKKMRDEQRAVPNRDFLVHTYCTLIISIHRDNIIIGFSICQKKDLNGLDERALC